MTTLPKILKCFIPLLLASVLPRTIESSVIRQHQVPHKETQIMLVRRIRQILPSPSKTPCGPHESLNGLKKCVPNLKLPPNTTRTRKPSASLFTSTAPSFERSPENLQSTTHGTTEGASPLPISHTSQRHLETNEVDDPSPPRNDPNTTVLSLQEVLSTLPMTEMPWQPVTTLITTIRDPSTVPKVETSSPLSTNNYEELSKKTEISNSPKLSISTSERTSIHYQTTSTPRYSCHHDHESQALADVHPEKNDDEDYEY